MLRILLLVVLLIVYGSLYPWRFHTTHLPASALWIVLHSWPPELSRFVVRDAIVNVLLYAPLGMFAYLAAAPHMRKSYAVAGVLLGAMLLSSGMEMIQLFDASRTSSAFDVLCNLIGAAAGILVANLHSNFITAVIDRSEIQALHHPSGAMILLFCWIGYEAMPLFPQLSTTQLLLKIRSLFGASAFSPADLAVDLVAWLAVAAVVEALVGVAKAGAVFLIVLLLVPARLLLDTRTVTPPQALAPLLAWLAWRTVLGTLEKHSGLLAWLSAGALLVQGLAPFRFSATVGQFSWIPFAASLSYEHAAAFVIFFRKCFLYGVSIWLLHKSCWRYRTATLWIAALLTGIEVAQIHLPGRTPEITDPLLACIMAVILKRADTTAGARYARSILET